MADPRIERYARLLVETCVDVQPRWQVVISTTQLGRPLAEEVTRQVARRGAYALRRTGLGADRIWVKEAPPELLAELPPLERRVLEEALFDEKIDGTIHLALGNGMPGLGSRNESTIHWDVVKDLRSGGRIELDGEPVQVGGAWRL